VSVRVGQGIDVHRFTDDPDRVLRLAGVEIPGAPGLEGHSDADVVLHAVVDALLGAAALGDIGTVFGTSDPRWAGAPSAGFVQHTLGMLTERGLRVGNLDCTVVAARPRLGPHASRMREELSALLGVDPGVVNLAATTTDGLGFTGRGEGIACLATVLLLG
jgi:2-C-methyl-D-erythritol 2,4-cyclodiphosphate synthase